MYTQSHWGLFEAENVETAVPRLKPWRGDPDPNDIGRHLLAPSVQALRVLRPAVRRSWLDRGPGGAPELRGREPFVEVEWQQALELVSGELARVRAAYSNEAIFAGSYGWASAGRFHHAQGQLRRFFNCIGGFVRHNDSYSLGAGRVIMPHVMMPLEVAWEQATSFDVMAEHTQLFVAFGGVPAKNAQIAQGGAVRHQVRAGLAAMARGGTRFVNISPVRDNLETGGAVEWIAIRPNTDTALMLALAHVLVREGLADRAFLASHCHGFERFEPYLADKTPAWAEAITGVPAARIAALAREMAASRTMINIAWALQRASHGEQPFWMTAVLAAMLGQIGLPGGGFAMGYGPVNTVGTSHRRLPGPTLAQGRNPVNTFIPVARIADMLLNPGTRYAYNGETHTYPDIRLIYWAGGNPFHHHQDLSKLMRAFRKPDSIIVHEQYWTPTAKFADIVLPASTTAERDDIGYSNGEGHVVAMRKLMEPLGEARSDHAIFAGLAARLGVAQAFTEGRDERAWLDFLYQDCRGRMEKLGVALPPFDEFWEQGLISLEEHDGPMVMMEAYRRDPVAHPLHTESGRIEIFSDRIASFNLADCPGHPVWMPPAEWLGNATAHYPLHLLSDQPSRRLHSQLDASPHSAAGKIQGREPIYINTADAGVRGIAAGDLVEVFNDRGRCLSAAIITDDIMPGVVRLNTGAWFDYDWQTGIEKHGNPNALTRDAGASSLSQGCMAQTCLVEIRRAAGPVPPVSAHALPEFAPALATAGQY